MSQWQSEHRKRGQQSAPSPANPHSFARKGWRVRSRKNQPTRQRRSREIFLPICASSLSISRQIIQAYEQTRLPPFVFSALNAGHLTTLSSACLLMDHHPPLPVADFLLTDTSPIHTRGARSWYSFMRKDGQSQPLLPTCRRHATPSMTSCAASHGRGMRAWMTDLVRLAIRHAR